MPKTGTQIKAWAESLTEGLILDTTSVILWINEFLTQEIGEDAMILATEDYASANDYTWHNLPAAFEDKFKVESFLSSGMEEINYYRDYTDFEIYDTKIKFSADGNYRLHYLTIPAEITAIGDSIGVNDCFNKACALWVAYRGLTNDDEDNAYSNSLGQLRSREYQMEKATAVQKRKAAFKRKGRIRNVQWHL